MSSTDAIAERQQWMAVLALAEVSELSAAWEAWEAVRLAPSQALLKSKPHELSGGMRQRVMIALALASSPQLLLADEPTTALDASVRMSVLKLLTDLRRERNLGLVIVSHDINAIATATDRVLVMNKGRVVETGPTPEVMSDPQDPYTQMLVAALPDRTPAGYYLPVQRAQDADSREDAKRLVPVPRRAAVTDALTTIVADRVNFSYREHQVLFDVSLSVRTGERIGIVGESGSGKSTLARLLTGVLPSPHVAVNDTPWRNVRRQHAERHAVQLILQDPFASLTPSQSALTTVAEAVRAANGATRRAAITQATELLESVGLAGEVIHRKPRELSGGQCQRVSIARALAVEPSILVADEPTSALDLSVQAGIVNLLLELTTQRPLGLVVVSHDLAVLAHLADSLIVMKDGRIVESGPTPQILHDAKHEYTRQLVSANPFLNLESEQDVRAHTGALA